MAGGREVAGEATDITRLLGGRFQPSPRTSLLAGEGEAASDLVSKLKSEITDSKHETKNSVCNCIECQYRSGWHGWPPEGVARGRRSAKRKTGG